MTLSTILHYIAIYFIPLILGITLHEAAHGWIASKLGDKTALMLGRVTLNPVKHIEPFGTIILPLVLLVVSNFKFAIGWAKPVPVTWQNLRHPRRDMALVAIAGPFSNFLMAFFWAAVAKVCLLLSLKITVDSQWLPFLKFLYQAGLFGININIILLLLNLLPLPPLDGSRIVSSLLPPRIAYRYEQIESFGIWILLILIVLGILGKILYPPLFFLDALIRALFGLPLLG